MSASDDNRPASPQPHPVRGLYVIADAGLVPARELLPRARAALEGGARVLQLRSKVASARERLAQARVLQVLCADFAVPLIVNDDLEAAAALGAGLHLGGDDRVVGGAQQRKRKPSGALGLGQRGDLGRRCLYCDGAGDGRRGALAIGGLVDGHQLDARQDQLGDFAFTLACAAGQVAGPVDIDAVAGGVYLALSAVVTESARA